jgi:hypothetical protein
MAPGSTKPVNGNEYEELSWGKEPLARETDVTAICKPTLYKMWEY